MKLVKITTSNNKEKKYIAYFKLGDTVKSVNFGAKGYEDYTMHKDKQRKKNYIKRHEKNEDWNNPLTPGALSKWLLWNKPTLEESIIDFKKRFNL